MTTKTRAQLVAMALDELMVVGSGQSPDSEDEQKVDSRYEGLKEELNARGIVSIADDDAIPIEWTGPLSELLANECARAFGKEKMSKEMRLDIEDRLQVIVNRVSAPNDTLLVDPMLTPGPGFLTLARWTRGG